MRGHDIVPRTLLILTVITFALAAPVLVQEKRQACADEDHVHRDVITVLGKRAVGDDLHMLWDGPWRFGNVWGEAEEHVPEVHAPPPNLAGVDVPEVHAPLPNLVGVVVPEVHAPPPNLAGVHVPGVHMPMDGPWDFGNVRGGAEEYVPGVHAPPPSPAGVHGPEVHGPWDFWNLGLPEGQVPAVRVPSHGSEDSNRESMELGGDAPPASPESGHSLSPPMSPQSSTKSEDWYTAPSSLGSSTESNSDSDSNRWSTISNAPSVESQSDNLKAADAELIRFKGKAKVERRISGTAGGVDMVNAAQMELRSAVDPRTRM